MRLGFTWGLFKQFVRSYLNHKSIEYAESGLRILTLSPGLIDMPMGRSEYEAGKQFIEQSAIKRMDKPEEIGQRIYKIADPRLTYLAVTDILVDGGVVANREKHKESSLQFEVSFIIHLRYQSLTLFL